MTMTGKELREIRKSKSQTQHEWAIKLGVSRKTIVAWEATEGSLDDGVDLQVRRLAGQIRLVEDTFQVFPTANGTYGVSRRRIIGQNRRIDGSAVLYGEFKRRDHAYRWCAALQIAKTETTARRTKKLIRKAEVLAASR